MAANLLRDWLMKSQMPMLTDFWTPWALPHKDGAVDDLPATVEETKLQAAVEKLLAKYPAEEVAVYLNAFYTMNDVRWPNLESLLKTEPAIAIWRIAAGCRSNLGVGRVY